VDLHKYLYEALSWGIGRASHLRPAVEEKDFPTAAIVRPGGTVHYCNGAERRFDGETPDPLEHTWPAARMYCIRNAWCTGNSGHVFCENGTWLGVCRSQHRLPEQKVRRPIRAIAQKMPGRYFHLTGFSHENHGHFLIHHLPRLLSVLDRLRDDPEIRILCAAGHSRWQGRYLSRLGVDPGRLVEIGHQTLHLEELWYVPIPDGSNRLCDPAFYGQLQQALCAQVPGWDSVSLPMGKPLWVSRRDAPDKKLANEEDLIKIADDLWGGLEVVELGGLSMDQQIALFRQAPLVLGPLGQGLTNILYGRGSCLVTINHGMPMGDMEAAAMFRSLALASGNWGVRLYAGQGYLGNKERSWFYPPDRFQCEMVRLKNIMEAPTSHPG